MSAQSPERPPPTTDGSPSSSSSSNSSDSLTSSDGAVDFSASSATPIGVIHRPGQRLIGASSHAAKDRYQQWEQDHEEYLVGKDSMTRWSIYISGFNKKQNGVARS